MEWASFLEYDEEAASVVVLLYVNNGHVVYVRLGPGLPQNGEAESRVL